MPACGYDYDVIELFRSENISLKSVMKPLKPERYVSLGIAVPDTYKLPPALKRNGIAAPLIFDNLISYID